MQDEYQAELQRLQQAQQRDLLAALAALRERLSADEVRA
jgi:hypothetical protein